MKKTKYGVTNQLAQIAKASRQPETQVNKLGEKIGATGLSLREQMRAAQNSSLIDTKTNNKRMIKNSNPNRGQYMDGGMAKKKMMKGGRSMYSAGGNASVMPVAKPN